MGGNNRHLPIPVFSPALGIVLYELADQDVWFRFQYNVRLQAELASYWIVRGDLKAAVSHAKRALQGAKATRFRKHVAWAHKLMGDIAGLEERVEDGQRHYGTASLDSHGTGIC